VAGQGRRFDSLTSSFLAVSQYLPTTELLLAFLPLRHTYILTLQESDESQPCSYGQQALEQAGACISFAIVNYTVLAAHTFLPDHDLEYAAFNYIPFRPRYYDLFRKQNILQRHASCALYNDMQAAQFEQNSTGRWCYTEP
jgi:hypothetical protein